METHIFISANYSPATSPYLDLSRLSFSFFNSTRQHTIAYGHLNHIQQLLTICGKSILYLIVFIDSCMVTVELNPLKYVLKNSLLFAAVAAHKLLVTHVVVG